MLFRSLKTEEKFWLCCVTLGKLLKTLSLISFYSGVIILVRNMHGTKQWLDVYSHFQLLSHFLVMKIIIPTFPFLSFSHNEYQMDLIQVIICLALDCYCLNRGPVHKITQVGSLGPNFL